MYAPASFASMSRRSVDVDAARREQVQHRRQHPGDLLLPAARVVALLQQVADRHHDRKAAGTEHGGERFVVRREPDQMGLMDLPDAVRAHDGG